MKRKDANRSRGKTFLAITLGTTIFYPSEHPGWLFIFPSFMCFQTALHRSTKVVPSFLKGGNP